MAILDRLRAATPTGQAVGVEANRAGLALVGAGAVLMVIALFLPQLESSLGPISENSFAQSGNWWFIGLPVLAVAAAYRVYQERQPSYSVLVIGLVGVVIAVYYGTGDRVELVNPINDKPTGEAASSGLGIYAGGIGGALVAYGGLLLAGWDLWPGGRQAPAKRTKRCPECAETVLDEARVCKHCGFRFNQQSAA